MAPQTSRTAALGLAPSQSLSQGLDEAVLKTEGNARVPSTHVNYDRKWRVFSAWCHNRQKIQSLSHQAGSLLSSVTLGLRKGD